MLKHFTIKYVVLSDGPTFPCEGEYLALSQAEFHAPFLFPSFQYLQILLECIWILSGEHTYIN